MEKPVIEEKPKDETDSIISELDDLLSKLDSEGPVPDSKVGSTTSAISQGSDNELDNLLNKLEVEKPKEAQVDNEKLTKIEKAILKGIASGNTSPKKLSKITNVDEAFIKGKIEELTKRGYLE